MTERKLEITSNCNFVKTSYGDPIIQTDVTLDYVERSPDPYFSDTETSIDINKAKAVEIIKFLVSAFDITLEELRKEGKP